MSFFHLLLPSLIRGADLLGMILLIGGLVFTTFIAPTSRTQSLRLFLLPSGFLLLIGMADLVVRSQMISSRPVAEIWTFLPKVLLNSHFGKVWMVRTFLLCLLGVISTFRFTDRLKQGIALITGATLLLTASLSGHAADSGSVSLPVLADWLHLLSASAWAGGIFFLASQLKRWTASPQRDKSSETLVPSIQRFSGIAGCSVVVLLITGGFQAWLQVGSFAALLETSYGKTLIVKLLLVLPLFGLGALNRYCFLPKLVRHALAHSIASPRKTIKHLFDSVVLEAGLALVIIAAAALLTQLPPAKSQLANAHAYTVSTHLGHGQPDLPQPAPAEGASVNILFPKDGQVVSSDEVQLEVNFIKGKRGHHIHAYVDGELMGMFESEKGTLTGITPGHHVLEVRVVAEDHVTELSATDKVSFAAK